MYLQWLEKSSKISWSLVIYKLPNSLEEPDLVCRGFFGRLSEKFDECILQRSQQKNLDIFSKESLQNRANFEICRHFYDTICRHFHGIIFNHLLRDQRPIQNFVQHLRWSFLRKQLTAENHELFSKKTPLFDKVLNTPLKITDPKNLEPLNFQTFSGKNNYKKLKAQLQFTHLEMSVTSTINSQNFIKPSFKVLQTLL